MKVTFNSDRSALVLHVDEEEQARLKEEQENNPDFDSDNFMFDFFESFIANSEYEWIAPEVCGDLTDAPILGIYLPQDEDTGDFPGVAERWGWMMYAIQSLQGELASKGRAVLLGP